MGQKLIQVDFLYPRWGAEHCEWESFLGMIKAAGYIGIEWYPYGENYDFQFVVDLLKKHDLQYSIVMTVKNASSKFETYLIELKKQLKELSSIGKGVLAPLFISAQTGREYYEHEQIQQCLDICKEVAQESNIPIYQETHRNKWTYALHGLAPMLKVNPDLKLTLDVSHWICVSESYLEDQQVALKQAIAHAEHLHARIGYPQGPQISDPFSAYYSEAIKESWEVWKEWIRSQIQKGKEKITITTEFGPFPYLMPEGSIEKDFLKQWKHNLWMKTYIQHKIDTLIIKA